ncbi:bZIP transcription factor 17-like [Rutidosis leptorrhynchoides]|uniref:bZIP transcription factor 17-like n=1 Tax=Rutidosis leptorrhynchoides TaxID=125765 RepID=UPI003A9976B7
MADAPQAVANPVSALPIPPLDSYGFSDDLTLSDEYLSFVNGDFDITFDDIQLEFFNSAFDSSNPIGLSSSDPEFNDFAFDHETIAAESGNLLEFQLNDSDHVSDVSGYLNISSPDKSVPELAMNSENLLPELNNENPVSSHGSSNCGSAGSHDIMNCDNFDNSDNCASPDSGISVVEQKMNCELGSSFMLKRKNEICDGNSESRTNKYRKSNETSVTKNDILNQVDEKDEKKKAKLIRNRESAQLSRQRKKQYVEELEDKVRAMHSTIQNLNAQIIHFATENARLQQQMITGSAGVGGGVCPPHVMYPPHPAMAPMGYPWMPCPPYPVKSQGSQVPLVPIPRLKPKPQPPVSSQKSKKTDVNKTECVSTTKSKTKTKKVASISFFGLLVFIVMFGGLVPVINMRFGVSSDYKYNNQNIGTVLLGNELMNGSNHRTGIGSKNRNDSEPLVASLYVPRNDKLVKIDGNLIIHSVLASEKGMAFREEQGTSKNEDTGLVPAIYGGRQPRMYRTSSDRQRPLSSDKENVKLKHGDGKLQQWFREGLAGPMLSSGMCSEVFQFDVSIPSSSGAIVQAPSVVNMTTENRHNSTTMKNRRILPGLPIPLPGPATNITKEKVSSHDSKHEDHHKNSSGSSMVVSVLVDPREVGDAGDMDNMMGGGKSFSRIFVVVLLDSVKYVTYSCMVPLIGASHLVTA